jgi:RES domain-containing protein
VIFWRISNYADLKGIGGLRTAGRWHNKGIPIVYLAEHPALALLEVLVNFDLELREVPEHFRLLEVEYDQRKSISRLNNKSLPDGWQQNIPLTRAIGDEWLMSATSLLLRVPSAVVPKSFNYLLNPRHPEAKVATILSVIEHPYDARLF